MQDNASLEFLSFVMLKKQTNKQKSKLEEERKLTEL